MDILWTYYIILYYIMDLLWTYYIMDILWTYYGHIMDILWTLTSGLHLVEYLGTCMGLAAPRGWSSSSLVFASSTNTVVTPCSGSALDLLLHGNWICFD